MTATEAKGRAIRETPFYRRLRDVVREETDGKKADIAYAEAKATLEELISELIEIECDSWDS